MAAQPTVLYLDPDNEVVIALKRAAREHQLILVKSGDDVFEIADVSARTSDSDDEEPDAILNLIGMLESREPSNIAECKDQYLADAIDPRPR